MASTVNERHSKQPIWRQYLMPVSLLLNAFLAALILGHVWRGISQNTEGETPLIRALSNAESALSPADAAQFRTVMTNDAPRFLPAGKRLEEAREVLKNAIAASPYDPPAVRAALAAWQARWNDFVGAFRDPLTDALGAISPDGRRRLIDARQKTAFIRQNP